MIIQPKIKTIHLLNHSVGNGCASADLLVMMDGHSNSTASKHRISLRIFYPATAVRAQLQLHCIWCGRVSPKMMTVNHAAAYTKNCNRVCLMATIAIHLQIRAFIQIRTFCLFVNVTDETTKIQITTFVHQTFGHIQNSLISCLISVGEKTHMRRATQLDVNTTNFHLFCQRQSHCYMQLLTRKEHLFRIIFKIYFTCGWHCERCTFVDFFPQIVTTKVALIIRVERTSGQFII